MKRANLGHHRGLVGGPARVRGFFPRMSLAVDAALLDIEDERLTGDEVPAGTPSMKDGDEIAVIVLEDAVTDGEQWKLSRLRRVRSPTRRQLTRE